MPDIEELTPTGPDLDIRTNDLSGDEIARFLEQHIEEMLSVSPPESKHALDLDGLKAPDITFWSVHSGGQLVGCGALKQLDAQHGEIKSMRTDSQVRGKGIAASLLKHILDVCRQRGYRQVSLETGSMEFFAPAHQLYRNHGFIDCGPFSQYREDPNSLFMTLHL